MAIVNSLVVTASLVALATPGHPARRPALCSVVPIMTYRDTRTTFFVGVGAPDTVLAGHGSTRVGGGPGHWGRGGDRPVFGQVVRVGQQLGGAASPAIERAFSKTGTREVVIVPWDYAPDCQPVAWGRSARWVESTQPGFFHVRPRPEAQWAGRPVLDAYFADLQPYPHGLVFQHGYRGTDALKTSASLTPDEYFGLYAALPGEVKTRRDSDEAAAVLTAWEGAHPDLATRYPASEILELARRRLERPR